MLRKIAKENLYLSDKGWLQSRFHFSFAEYHNPQNIHFGVLRVLNDDVVRRQSGFDMHPHRDMEIISYIIDGEITHKDSMGHERTLKRGEVQYMSAGTGVYHSEYNNSASTDLRLLQIWLLPSKKGLEPNYGEEHYGLEERKNRLLHLVSDQEGDAKVKIHQDVNIYVSELDSSKKLMFDIAPKRQIYFVQIEGDAVINSIKLSHSDAMEITDETRITIEALSASHFLFIEMAQS